VPIAWTNGGSPAINAANLNKLAVVDDVSTAGTPTGDALRAAYGAVVGVDAGLPSGGDDTATLQGLINNGATAIRLRPFATYKVGTLTAPAYSFHFQGIGSTILATTASPVITKNGVNRVSFFGVDVTLLSEANKVTDAHSGFLNFNGQLNGRTERDSDRGPLNLANFAGQGTDPSVIGFTFHNYTDGTAMQLDNVGSGAMLVLKNAQNSTRRNDKASNYVGTSIYLQLQVDDVAAGFSRSLFYMDSDGRMVWTGATTTAATGGKARFLANKADDGSYAYSFELTNPHLNLAAFGGALEMRSDVALTRGVLRSMSGMTNGLMLDSVTGPLTLSAGGGTDAVRLAVPLRFNVTASHTTTATAGSATLPANPLGFVTVQNASGTSIKIPYYAV
jgi:hypothetical protein